MQPIGSEAQLTAQLYNLFIAFAWWQHRFDTSRANTMQA